MDIAGWKASIYDNLWKLHFKMDEYKAKALSGLLSGVALWPIIHAAQQGGDEAAFKAFREIAGEIGAS